MKKKRIIGALFVWTLLAWSVVNSAKAATDIAAGSYHSLSLNREGQVLAWGYNGHGQLGRGDTSPPSDFQADYVTNVSRVVAVAAGGDYDRKGHSLALDADGNVWSWGHNAYGQLGDDSTLNRNVPVPVEGISNIVKVAGAGLHSIALCADGTVWSWGYNLHYQLGLGHNTSPKKKPEHVSGLSNVVDIATGNSHTLALTADGEIYTWGYGVSGQLGHGDATNAHAPTKIQGISKAVRIGAGIDSSFAVSADGSVKAWGLNSYGRLGIGLADPLKNSPTTVPNVSGAALAVEAGYHLHILNNGLTMQMAGYGLEGATGNGDLTQNNYSLLPITNISDVATITAGAYHSLAAKRDGTLWAWGDNPYGEIGVASPNAAIARPNKVQNVDVAEGIGGHSLIVDVTGVLFASGRNSRGQLGDSTLLGRNVPVRIGNSGTVVASSAGKEHSLAVGHDGKLRAWGRNSHGQLGYTGSSYRKTPKVVAGISNASMVAAGNAHSIVLLKDNTLLGAGRNNEGQLGTAGFTNENVFIPIESGQLNDVIYVAAGANHTLALRSDGSIATWGNNSHGQLGDGSTTDRQGYVEPTLGSDDVSSIAAGDDFSLLLEDDGDLIAFGDNRYGQLGDGSTSNASNYVSVSSISDVLEIAAGSHHAVVLRSDRTVWTWGGNELGQLGIGSTTAFTNEPVQVPGLSNVVSIQAHGEQSFATLADGTVWGWGGNLSGELGTGLTGIERLPVPTQFKWFDTYNPYLESTLLTVTNRYVRGTPGSTNPIYHSFVIPLDYQYGMRLDETGDNSSIYGTNLPWFARIEKDALKRHIAYDYSGAEIQNDNPIAAFGSDAEAMPLWIGKHYKFGTYFGKQRSFHTVGISSETPNSVIYQLDTPIRVFVYRKSEFANGAADVTPIATNYLSLPARNHPISEPEYDDYLRFASNNLVASVTGHGLETTVQIVDGVYGDESDAWGANKFPDETYEGTNGVGVYHHPAYVISHRGTSEDYRYVVEGLGVTISVDRNDTNIVYYLTQNRYVDPQPNMGSQAWQRLYALNFSRRPKSLPRLVNEVQFDGEPAPPRRMGARQGEATVVPVNKAFTELANSDFLELDNSPELRKHPLLERFVEDMRYDPLLLAQFVLNEIELTDPLSLSHTTNNLAPAVQDGGVSRGALGVYLERQGSPTEQCALLVYLLRQAGVPAGYVFPGHDGLLMHDYELSKLLEMQLVGAVNFRGMHYTTESLIRVDYPWVVAEISPGNCVHIFPWLKDIELTEGLDLYDYLPEQFDSGYEIVKAYVNADPTIMDLSDHNDSLADLLPRFVHRQVTSKHPGLSLEDFGYQARIRKRSLTDWGDLPIPTVATNDSTWEIIANLVTGELNLPRLTNIFNLTRIQVHPKNDPDNVFIDTGDMRVADIHNRRLLLFTNGTELELNLESFRPEITNVLSFTNDVDLTNAQRIIGNVAGEDEFRIRILYERNRARTNDPGYFAFHDNTTTPGNQIITNTRSYLRDDWAGIAIDVGRVSKEMLEVHWLAYEAAADGQTNAAPDPTIEVEGALSYLLGRYFQNSESEFRKYNERLHKVRRFAGIQSGVSSLHYSVENGTNYVQPKVDMSFALLSQIGSGVLRLDRDDAYWRSLIDQTWIQIAAGSAEEHMAINRFFGHREAISTIKLLHYAREAGDPGVFELTPLNYLESQHSNMSTNDPQMWSAVVGALGSGVAGFNLESARAFVTEQEIVVPGVYTGHGALIWSPLKASALINGFLNGGTGPKKKKRRIFAASGRGSEIGKAWLNPEAELAHVQEELVYQEEGGMKLISLMDQNIYLTYFEESGVQQLYAVFQVEPGAYEAVPVYLDALNRGVFDSRQNSALLKAVADPVDAVSGNFYIDDVDMALAGPMPLTVRRNYSSQNQGRSALGFGWKLSYAPNLVRTTNSAGIMLISYEPDGSVIQFGPGTNGFWRAYPENNPMLAHNNQDSSSQRLLSGTITNMDVGGVNTYLYHLPHGEVRTFATRDRYGITNLVTNVFDRIRPYLTSWKDASGNEIGFEYGEERGERDFGELRRAQSSNGGFLQFKYDGRGQIVSVVSSDGRTVEYEHDVFGDLVRVRRPDGSQIEYDYEHYVGTNTNDVAYLDSTHLIQRLHKPDGRILENEYDTNRAVVKQWATVGSDLSLVHNATFVYENDFNLQDGGSNEVNGVTHTIDAFGNTNSYYYTNSLIRRSVDALGQEVIQDWYLSNSPGGFARAVKSRTDERGLTSTYSYDTNGNTISTTVSGADLTGNGVTNVTSSATYDAEFRLLSTTDPMGRIKEFIYDDPNFNRLATRVISKIGSNQISTMVNVYANVTNMVTNAGVAFTNAAFGMLVRRTNALGTTSEAVSVWQYDGRGFVTASARLLGTNGGGITNLLVHNSRGDLVESWDPSNRLARTDFDMLGRPTGKEIYDDLGNLVSSESTYYNDNGEVTWSDGPRYNPEDYVWRDHDGAGNVVQEVRWRSRANADGTGVEAVPGHALYSTAFREFDFLGNLSRETDQLGNYNLMRHDANGQVVRKSRYSASEAAPLATEFFAYEPGGKVEYHTNAIGGVTFAEYTTTGLKKLQINADGSTNRWEYDLIGREVKNTLRNGSFWVTDYLDVSNTVIRTYYDPSGSNILDQSMQISDLRGNVIRTVDAEGNHFQSVFDELDRVVQTIGPPGVTNQYAQQVSYASYDSAGIWKTNSNSAGVETVTRHDALGRTLVTWIYDLNVDPGTPIRQTSNSYSPDFNSVTFTTGSTNSVSVTTFTDTFGNEVLTRYADGSYVEQRYDVLGNLVESIDEIHRASRFYYDAFNRVNISLLPDGNGVTNTYDRVGNLTEKSMPAGLTWSASYSTAGQLTNEFLAGGALQSREFGSSYHTSGPFVGLLHQTTDPRGITTTTTYDDQMRIDTISSDGTGLGQDQVTDFDYDLLGRITKLTRRTEGVSTSSVERVFDPYGQMIEELVIADNTLNSHWLQNWDAGGRREKLNQEGAGIGRAIDFAYDAAGALKQITQGSLTANFEYNDAGNLNRRIGPWRTWKVTDRDIRGRHTDTLTTVNSTNVLAETLVWRTNSTLATYSADRNGHDAWNENRQYGYNTRGHLLTETVEPDNGVLATNLYGFDPSGLGLLIRKETVHDINSLWQGQTNSLGRIVTETNDGPAQIKTRALGRIRNADSYSVSANSVPLTGLIELGDTTNRVWFKDLSLAAGSNHSVTAIAEFPRALIVRRSVTNDFRIRHASLGATNQYDEVGNLVTRYLSGGRSQTLTWDAAGQLIRLVERDAANDGFDWESVYDGLGRRLRVTWKGVTNSISVEGSETHTESYFDPLVEFGELGVSVDGDRTWKMMGPDLSGAYGGAQGIGGIEGEIRDSTGENVGVLTDHFGHVVASVLGPDTLWTRTRLDGYGPIAGYELPVLEEGGYASEVSLWRSRRTDRTGLIWMGARYYDRGSGRFISPDPAGHGGSWDLYAYAAGDPVNYFDPDGRLVSKALQQNVLGNRNEALKLEYGFQREMRDTMEYRYVYKNGMDTGVQSLADNEHLLLPGRDELHLHQYWNVREPTGNMLPYFGEERNLRFLDDYGIASREAVDLGAIQRQKERNFVFTAVTIAQGGFVLRGFVGRALSKLPSSLRASNTGGRQTVIHFTDDAGHSGITSSKQLFNSTGSKHARFGDGQYFTDITPQMIGAPTKAGLTAQQISAGQMSLGQASSKLFGVPWNGNKMSYFIEIDVTGLKLLNPRGGTFLFPNNKPLDLTGRIVRSGKTLE